MSLDHGPGTEPLSGHAPANEPGRDPPKRAPLGEEAVPVQSPADRRLEEENRARLQPVIGRRRRLRPQAPRPVLPRPRGRTLLAVLAPCALLALLLVVVTQDGTEPPTLPGLSKGPSAPQPSAPLAGAPPPGKATDDRAATRTRRRAALRDQQQAARRRARRRQRERQAAATPREAQQPEPPAPVTAPEVPLVSAVASEPPSEAAPPPSSAVTTESPTPSSAQREFNFER